MNDSTPLDLTEPVVPAQGEPDASTERGYDPVTLLRKVLWILLITALVSVAAATAVNWLSVRPHARYGEAKPAPQVATRYNPSVLHLDKSPVDLLPGDILAYETIARQGIPGQEKQAAEAIYKTLNMDLDMLLPMSVYARVEGFSSTDEAKKRADQMLTPYPADQANVLLNGVTVVRSGYTKDYTAYGVVWARGPYVTFVKALYDTARPADSAKSKHYLDVLSDPVTKSIDIYQRTGAQGAQLGTNK